MADPILPGLSPPAIPGYTLLRCIGRGSYGDVWLARSDTGEFRAVKVVYRQTFEHDRPFERELSGIQKFEPISRTHPSQVSILHVGVNQPEGYFYYVMELADDGRPATIDDAAPRRATGPASAPPWQVTPESVAGYQPRTLKHDLQQHTRLPIDRCIDIGLALGTALEHLHRHELIHRDIKPSNVIFVNGVPKLADIGLVTDVGASVSHVGTEGFVPPEGPGTRQADIYSFGKVLYEMATGRDRMDFPELPTFVEDMVEKNRLLELNQIFLKACQNQPRKRYASAGDLLADLTLLKSGKSVRRARTVEQRLAGVRLAGASLALLAGLFLLLDHLHHRRELEESRRTSDIRREARLQLSQESRQSAERLADLATANGGQLRALDDPAGALLWFARALLDEPSPAAAARLQARQRDLQETWRLCVRPAWLLPTTAGLQGFCLAADPGKVLTFDNATDQPIRFWNVATGGTVGDPFALTGQVLQAKLASAGDRALTLTRDGPLRLWEALSSHPIPFDLEPRGTFSQVEFSGHGRQFLGIAGTEVLVWHTGSHQLQFVLRHAHPVRAAAFSPDGKSVATLDASALLQSWSMISGRLNTNAALELPHPAGLQFHPDSRRVAVWAGHKVRLWDARSGQWAAFVALHDDTVRSAAFSPDGRLLLTWADDRTVRLWDLNTAQARTSPWRHAAPIRKAIFSPDGRFVASASEQQVRLWNLSEPAASAPSPLVVHATPPVDMHFNASADLLVFAGADGTLRSIEVDPAATPTSLPKPAAADQWMIWAQLLSGRALANGSPVPLPAARVRELLEKVKPHFQANLDPEARAAWHRQRAEQSETEKSWFAAAFHWAQAAMLKPAEKSWEERRLHAEVLFRQEDMMAARSPDLARRLPPRPAAAGRQQVDLSSYYNAMLDETWLPSRGVTHGNDLADLPQGLQKFGGIEFDVRGIVQLSGGALEGLGGRFPREIRDIAVHQRCRRLHVLHGAAWSALTGTWIATYRLHYENGSTQEIKIRFGQHLREWWAPSNPTPATPAAAIAWEGGNTAARAVGMRNRLYQMIWLNPLPDIAIRSIDLVSSMDNPAPFVIAISLD